MMSNLNMTFQGVRRKLQYFRYDKMFYFYIYACNDSLQAWKARLDDGVKWTGLRTIICHQLQLRRLLVHPAR